MHFAFIPYGKREEVEILLRDMSAQKHKLKMTKGKEVIHIWIQGQVRLLPFGVYEYVFPREDLDKVLTALNAKFCHYSLPKVFLSTLRKMLHLKKIPDYSEEQKYLWVKSEVNLIPLGIRDDEDIIEPLEEYRGFTHEAI